MAPLSRHAPALPTLPSSSLPMTQSSKQNLALIIGIPLVITSPVWGFILWMLLSMVFRAIAFT